MGIFLNAGLLKSTSRTIGDYRIEWRKGSTVGTVVFVSGIGSDLSLQSQHPIVNEIVESGNLYPIITYVYIDGFKVTSQYEIGVIFSPDLIGCLDFITIDNINCATVYANDNVYPFKLAYNNVSDTSDNKSRILNYVISPTTNYLAWEFETSTIADGLKIYYCTFFDPVGVLIENYITGYKSDNNNYLSDDLEPVDYPNNPIIMSKSYALSHTNLRQLTPLSAFTYASGDYLKVEVIGSVLDPTNNNTNWNLALSCLESFDKTTFNTKEFGKIDLSVAPVMTFDNDRCAYFFTYQVLEAAYELDKNLATNIDLIKFLSMGGYETVNGGGSIGSIPMLGNQAVADADYETRFQQAWISFSYGNCNNLPTGQLIEIDKTVGHLSIILPTITHYNNVLADIITVTSHADFIEAINANPITDIAYYAKWNFRMQIAESCGDSATTVTYSIPIRAVITYDEANLTVNIDYDLMTNQYNDINESCNNLWSSVEGIVNQYNNYHAIIRNEVSSIIYDHPFGALKAYGVVLNPHEMISWRRFNLPAIIYDHLITPAELEAIGFCLNLNGNQWFFYKQYDRITMTNPSTARTRLHSFTLERQKQLRTGLCTDLLTDVNNYELVYTSPNTACGSALVTGTLINGTP